MFSKSLSLLGLAALPASFADHVHDHSSTITWASPTNLPLARSDLTATVASSTASGVGSEKIFLVGGCDAEAQIAADWGGYFCPSVTNRCDAYDPVTDTYSDCADAPQPRYRHAAANVNGKIFLVGGSDPMDAAVKDIEVYDPIADSWSVYGTWEGATSDLAAFAIGTDLYVVGGYDVTDFAFTAQTAMFKIDTTLDELSLEAAEPLNTGRGDIFAAVADNHAYVTGGFTHEDSWCSPHASVERIDLANPSAGWEVVESTAYNRGDKALVHMNGFIYAVGGETKEGCDGEASGTTKPVEHVEVYDVSTGKWVEDTVIPEETFRFVAVGHEASDSIFIFGGQNYHDETCDCYPISDEVLKFTDSSWVIDILDDVNGSGPGFKPGLSAGAGLASLFTAAMLFMYI